MYSILEKRRTICLPCVRQGLEGKEQVSGRQTASPKMERREGEEERLSEAAPGTRMESELSFPPVMP